MNIFEVTKRYDSIEFMYVLDMKQINKPTQPIYLCGDQWYLTSTRQINVAYNVDILNLQICHNDLSNRYKGTWSLTRLDETTIHKDFNTVREEQLDKKIRLVISSHLMGLINLKVMIRVDVVDVVNQHSVNNTLTHILYKQSVVQQSSDVMIITEDNSIIIPVHKAILIQRSPVFKAMFDSNLTESNTNQIQIPDFDVNIIKRMVEFLYKGTFSNLENISYEDLISLLAIANKYEVICLKDVSARYIASLITIDNVADVRRFAIMYNSTNLLEKCVHFIQINAQVLFKDDHFLSTCSEYSSH
jgi:hypothetical protein